MAISEDLDVDIMVYSFDDVIYVKSSDTKRKEISVLNMVGQEIFREVVSDAGICRIELSGNTGYYLVNVQTGDDFISRKVFVK